MPGTVARRDSAAETELPHAAEPNRRNARKSRRSSEDRAAQQCRCGSTCCQKSDGRKSPPEACSHTSICTAPDGVSCVTPRLLQQKRQCGTPRLMTWKACEQQSLSLAERKQPETNAAPKATAPAPPQALPDRTHRLRRQPGCGGCLSRNTSEKNVVRKNMRAPVYGCGGGGLPQHYVCRQEWPLRIGGRASQRQQQHRLHADDRRQKAAAAHLRAGG